MVVFRPDSKDSRQAFHVKDMDVIQDTLRHSEDLSQSNGID